MNIPNTHIKQQRVTVSHQQTRKRRIKPTWKGTTVRNCLVGLVFLIAIPSFLFTSWKITFIFLKSQQTASSRNGAVPVELPLSKSPVRLFRTSSRSTSLSSSSLSSDTSVDAIKIHNTTSSFSSHKVSATPVVAHVVSLIKCSKSHMVTGFLDAAAVLRHSIHLQSNYSSSSSSSSETNVKSSRYSYEMIALIHPSCQQHAPLLQQLGYTTMIKSPPVTLEDLPPDSYYRRHVVNENCCGIDELIKLYAYQLTQFPIVAHWDMDVLILQPMDDLFDAILYPHDSERGRHARTNLQLQHPHLPLPEKIEAFLTRDVTSAQPWEIHQGVQGGFLIVRPNPVHFQMYVDFIKQANYSSGRGTGSGWGGLGYGGFQGAMAYQGVVAYFYDQIVSPKHVAVELNICRWNQVVADVIWRGPNRLDLKGVCREFPKLSLEHASSLSSSSLSTSFTLQQLALLQNNTHCEDCRSTPIELVKTVHYTACKKPWECLVPHPRKAKEVRQQYRLNHLTNVTTCGLLFAKWFEMRKQVEMLIMSHHNKNIKAKYVYQPAIANGDFHPKWFKGYCRAPGQYIAMNPPPEGLQINNLYFG